MMSRGKTLLEYFTALSERIGPCNWWPGDSPFEIAIGAILTQNTNWANVEKAIANLRDNDALSLQGLRKFSIQELQELIRPSGFFRIKAERIFNFIKFLEENSVQCISDLAERETSELREELLEIKGIGPETADSILLYAANKPVFVVDAYTKRIFNRHLLVHEDIEYHELQDFFMDVLEQDSKLFNEYHALIVMAAKRWCKKTNPDCANCPLNRFLDN